MGLLASIAHPSDVKKLSIAQLGDLATEIRERIIEVVGKNGGHLASNLGVAEITIALHYCFDFEKDRLLWDVGHQCYPHKLLTGRNARFDTLRQSGGISGFPNVDESPFDLFNVGHAGTAIPTALGLARADQILGRDNRVVAFVGDASIVNGLAFEGLNQAGTLKRQFLVVLNDNNYGIAPTRGALAEYLARFRASSLYEEVKQRARQLLPRLPLVGQPMFDALGHLKQGLKATVSPHSIFEQLGFMYVGPVMGHDVAHLVDLLRMLKDVDHPVLLHIHTNKGQGAAFARAEPSRFHAATPFEYDGETVTVKNGSGRTWTEAFSDALLEVGREEPALCALTAAMPAGTGLDKFAETFPNRFFDAGIAESCAVDMAAGMARAGLKPLVAVYSTFLQRSFDQIFQEVSLQRLPVILCMDRAGLVGGDGAVHHGFLDIACLRTLPNLVLLAPADERELKAALRFAVRCPQACAIRYPRADLPKPMGEAPPFETGRARLMRKGDDATILAYGACVAGALDAAELLAAEDLSVGVFNARFAKPIDADMLTASLLADHPVITVEDHSVVGGVGSAVLEAAQDLRLPTDHLVRLGIPADRFISQGLRKSQLAECGIDAAGIAETVHRELAKRRTPADRTRGRQAGPVTDNVARP